MKVYSTIILIVLFAIPTILASINGKCTNSDGICITTDTCSNYGGQTYNEKCPTDPSNVKCCDSIPCQSNDGRSGKCTYKNQCSGDIIDGKCPGGSDFKCCVGSGGGSSSTDSTYNGPCYGGGGACINIDIFQCGTSLGNGMCPGGTNVKCCLAGSKPSWYINQGLYTRTIYRGNGDNDSVANAGCGIASLAMGIYVTTKVSINPENLFQEGVDNGLYWGGGFCHDSISTLGTRHGVSLSWTNNVRDVFNALSSGKGVIFHVGYESKYHFTKGGHYIFLYGAKKQNNVQKVYVFDPNGYNNYVNILFPFLKEYGGIEVAKKGTGADFAIISKR